VIEIMLSYARDRRKIKRSRARSEQVCIIANAHRYGSLMCLSKYALLLSCTDVQ